MKPLSEYIIKEFDTSGITDVLSLIKDINDTTNDIENNELVKNLLSGESGSNKRRINDIINKLINDPDISDWYDGSKSEFELRRLLSKKLDRREQRMLDDIVDKLMNM